MAKHLSDDELRDILASQKPGMRLATHAAEPDAAPVLDGLFATPELPLTKGLPTSKATRKWSAETSRATAPGKAGGAGAVEEQEEEEEEEGDPPDDDDVQAILVEVSSAGEVDATEAPPRVLLISKSKRRIVGEQG